jgi:cell division protein FtsB
MVLAVSKVVSERTSAHEEVRLAQQETNIWKEALEKQYKSSLAALSQQVERSEQENAEMLRKTQAVLEELARYKHAMRTYSGQ